MKTAAPDLTKLSIDDRSAIGKRLQLLVHAGQSAKGDLPLRWQKNEAFFENEAPNQNTNNKIVNLHVNYLSIRVYALSSMVCGILGRQEPYMIAKDMQNGDRAERLEKALHFFWQRAEFEYNIRQASTVAANTNKAIWKLWYRPYSNDLPARDAITKVGPTLEVIHPDNWVCVPAAPEGLEFAKLCGNRFFRRRRWIKEQQAAGVFLEDAQLTAGDVANADESGSIQRSKADPSETGGELDDDQVELWDLTVRLDPANWTGQDSQLEAGQTENLYRIILALDTADLLLIEPLGYSRAMYFEGKYIPDEKNYWTGRSVSYNLQGLQEVYNLVHSALYNAVMTQAMPLVIGSGLPEKFTRYGWGDVLDAKDMVQTPWAAPSVFQGGQALMVELQNLERIGDQTARVSQNTMGSVVAGDTTATEQSITAAGVTQGQEEYIANFSAPFGAMASATMEVLERNWDDWFPKLGLQPATQKQPDPTTGEPVDAPVMDTTTGKPQMTGMVDLQKTDLDAQVLWETTGKTPGNTPQAKMQASQLLLQAAASLPQSGGDVYELFKVLVRESGLNAEGVQIPEKDMPGQQVKTFVNQNGIPPDKAIQFIQQGAAQEAAIANAASNGQGAPPQMAAGAGGPSVPGLGIPSPAGSGGLPQ